MTGDRLVAAKPNLSGARSGTHLGGRREGVCQVEPHQLQLLLWNGTRNQGPNWDRRRDRSENRSV